MSSRNTKQELIDATEAFIETFEAGCFDISGGRQTFNFKSHEIVDILLRLAKAHRDAVDEHGDCLAFRLIREHGGIGRGQTHVNGKPFWNVIDGNSDHWVFPKKSGSNIPRDATQLFTITATREGIEQMKKAVEILRHAISEPPPDDYSLDEDEMSILKFLHANHNQLYHQKKIADNITRSLRNIADRLQVLEKHGLIHRPDGKRKGYRITEKGCTLIGNFAR